MGNIPDKSSVKSYRELMLEEKVQWARKRNLHPNAIEYAGKYLNLNEQELELISDYERAADLAPEAMSPAMREAWQRIIFYLRSVARKEKEAA